ncbi:MAG: response regulator transcription factor [Actinomycetota bacterium]|nr:response regulator transcription factor [Actinomycetota bacterium]
MSRVLIVEDEPRIASFLEKGLRAEGFTPTVVSSGVIGLDYALTGEFDLAILDIGLPDIDGYAVLKRMRESGSSLPVIVLTARDSVTDTVRGLEGGADDYMPKPFRFAELLARVRLRLRERPTGGEETTAIERGNVRLDLVRREVTVAGKAIELSAREFLLTEMFLRHPGQVLSREQLLSHVWGYEFDPGSNIVDVYVGYLRKKLGASLIATVRGMGYRYDIG